MRGRCQSAGRDSPTSISNLKPHRVRPASFRPGERTSATEEAVLYRIVILGCPLARRPGVLPQAGQAPAALLRGGGCGRPGPGGPRCWVTGPPGGSCSATPSSSWPRNTDSGPGPSSGRTSRASALPATGRSPGCGRRRAVTPRRPMACSPSCAAATRARCNGCGPMCPGTPLPPTPLPPSFATRGWSSPGRPAFRPGGSSWRPPRNPSATRPNARRTSGGCARRPKPCWPATPPGWPA